ncbi:MAG: histidinol-phosphate transaminase [Sphaerochaetaceae bacterium]|jgi:histidinol-phosphate aminotransferase|nr:histidinol-phosphate transaminase [Sphaerochaetaceae bacterium]MDD4218638.1 histidinol-phosphate transaminase [Sphaerochaetaceae bacterium]MDY0371280.1 histidinol-phosphate transaminase [Sphaerochaetaceae bacterium]
MSAFSITQLMRPNIVSLKPYSSARNEFTGDAEVFLDANENWRDFVRDSGLNRYPDPAQKSLKQKIAKVMGLPEANLVIGNGSDEMIDLMFRIFCVPHKDKVLIIEPTYGAYSVFAAINDTGVSSCRLKENFALDLPRMEAICHLVNNGTPQTGMHKMLFICSPNNPSGNSYPLKDIAMIAQRFSGITIVDEAYYEFSDKPSAVSLMESCPRLVVLRTFSKSWGLANVRVGIAIAPLEIVETMHKVKYPYNLSGVAQELAEEVLNHADEVAQNIETIKAERARVAQQLRSLPFVEQVFPSDANFLLVRVLDPDNVCLYLRERGIIIRNRSTLRGCFGCVRITIGSRRENDILLKVLKQMEV